LSKDQQCGHVFRQIDLTSGLPDETQSLAAASGFKESIMKKIFIPIIMKSPL
jgi:hypothetical protein